MTFLPTESVIWTPSPISAVNGLTHYTLEWAVHNPCKSLFSNITGDIAINENLLQHCETKFTEKIVEPLNNFCNDTAAPVGNREKRLIGDIAAMLISSASMIMVHDIKKNDIPYLRESVDQIRTTIENDTRVINKLTAEIQHIREESMAEHRINSRNAQKLAYKIAELEQDVETSSEASYVMADFLDKVETTAGDMLASKYAWHHERKISLELFNMMGAMKHYNDDIASFGLPRSCKASNNKLALTFTAFKKDVTSTIYEANAFDHVNGTKDRLCVVKHIAPPLVMVNVSSGCYKELTKKDIQKDNTVRTSCQHQTISKNQQWTKTDCDITEKLNDRPFQGDQQRWL